MFSQVVVGTKDLERAKQFYDAILGQLGYGEGTRQIKGDGRQEAFGYFSENGRLILTQSIDDQPVPRATEGPVTFICQSAKQVEYWYAAGIAMGGKTEADPPGLRDTEAGPLYLANMRDPDGNKLRALHHAGHFLWASSPGVSLPNISLSGLLASGMSPHEDLLAA